MSRHILESRAGTDGAESQPDRVAVLERRVRLLFAFCLLVLLACPLITLGTLKLAGPTIGVAGQPGPVGPVGPVGPQGAPGIQGPAGKDGQVPSPAQVASVLLPQQCTRVDARFVQLEDATTRTGFPETMRILTCG